jgi:hypothetical protein
LLVDTDQQIAARFDLAGFGNEGQPDMALRRASRGGSAQKDENQQKGAKNIHINSVSQKTLEAIWNFAARLWLFWRLLHASVHHTMLTA